MNKIIDNSFKYLNRNVYRILKYNSNVLHNPVMLKEMNNTQSRLTWEGNLCCGVTTIRLQDYLNKKNIRTFFECKQIGGGRHVEDHCYLTLTDSNNKTIIIDPTWRQFLRSYSDTYDPYLKEIYNNNPFIFCGTYEDLEELYDKLEKIHMECFNLPLTNKENLVFYKHYKSYNF